MTDIGFYNFLHTFITLVVSSQFSETAGTRGCTEDGCNPGKEAPCWCPQWLVFPWQAPSGGAGAPSRQRPSRQQLQAEHHSQRQVSRGNTCTCRQWSCYCRLQETVENNSVVRQNFLCCGSGPSISSRVGNSVSGSCCLSCVKVFMSKALYPDLLLMGRPMHTSPPPLLCDCECEWVNVRQYCKALCLL